MAEELPLFLGLNDKTVTDIPKTVEKQRYMTSVAPMAANPGKWVAAAAHADPDRRARRDRMPGQDPLDRRLRQASRRSAVSTRCSTRKAGSWSLKAPFPHPCNHVAGVVHRHENLHLRRLRRAEPLPAFQMFCLRHRNRPMGIDRADLAAARRRVGDRARRQDSSARRPRRTLGRMA